MEKHSIKYGKRTIEFEVERKNIKNINLNVRPDMAVVVSANPKVPNEFLLKFVRDKATWIVKNICFFQDVQPERISKKEYISGETFKYLGKQYRLRVEDAEEESVRYFQGFIELRVRERKNRTRKETLVNEWFRAKAHFNFQESLNRVYPLVQKYGIKKPEIQIRTMKARWGSCIKDRNSILLNNELVKAPKFCIDYVVLHELLHFRYRNHDAEFYNLMTALMPDWKQRKEILDEEVVRGL
ncbi:MAG: SprT family zinc-dependent metalloprotease [Bacillota bacterium]